MAVSVLAVPAFIQNCSDKCCHSVSHRADISQHYDKLVDIMISASEHIPHTCKPNENTRVPGWITYVNHFKDKSMYWKEMYDSQKPNVSHYTTYMMKTSRNAYHYAIQRLKHLQKIVKRATFMDTMMQGNRQFMQEARRRKIHRKTMPSSVDCFSDSQDIANQFASKYSYLYNSSESDKRSIDDMWDTINHDVISGKNVAYTPNNIQDAIGFLQNGKQDGVYDLMTDHFVHLPECFLRLISDFYNSCIIYGFIPDKMLMSTIVPILKGSKGASESDNYRAISLCVLF